MVIHDLDENWGSPFIFRGPSSNITINSTGFMGLSNGIFNGISPSTRLYIYHYIILPSARALRPTDTPLYIHVHMVFKGLRRVSRVFSGLI